MSTVPKDRTPSTADPDEGPAFDVDLEALRIHRDDDGHAAAYGVGGGGERRPVRVRRWPLFLVLLLLLGAVGFAAFSFDPPSRQPKVRVKIERVPAWEVKGAPLGKGFSAAGWVKLPLHHPVQVTPLVEGRVEAIDVIEGDPVAENQVIARLYARDYQARYEVSEASVRAARATHEKMKAGYRTQEVAEAKAEVEGLEAELAVASRILERSRELEPTGAIPLEELQLDETKVETLEAKLSRARERLALLVEGYRHEDVDLAAAALAKAEAERDLAKLQLDYCEIRSPIRGVVLQRHASRGQWLKPNTGLIVDVYDPTDLQARVDVNQDDVSRVYVGQVVEVTTRVEPGHVYAGRVVLIEPKADLVKNTVPVRVKLTGLDGKALLYPDMVVTARFLTKPPDPSEVPVRPEITVAAAAVLPASAGNPGAVWIVDSGVLRRSPVVLGETRGERVVVTKGLMGGERVVVNPLPGFEDGVAVQIAD
jgi:RND family efflux transporter MFP subunit